MIVAGWAGSVDRLRLVRLVVEEVEVGGFLMQRGVGDGDADHGAGEQLVVPVVEAAALAPCGELGFGHALVQRALLFGGQGLGLRAFLAVEHALAAVGVHAAADGVEQAPLPHDHREVFAHLGDHRRVGVSHEVVVVFHGLRAAHHFGGHEVLVGVEDHVLEFRRELAVIPAHEVLPLFDVETVVEHHGLVRRQRALVDVAQTVVGGDVEVLEPVESDRAGAFGELRVDRLVAFGHVHHRPGGGGVRLVDDLDAHQRLAMAVPLGEAFEHGQHEFDFVGQLRPFAHAGDAAVVEAVLAHRRGVQVDEDGQAIFLGPVEGFVEFVDAADQRCTVAEDEVRHGDARSSAPTI